MADSTIDDQEIYLNENQWPGFDLGNHVPEDGFLGSAHHNVSADADGNYPYKLGSRVKVYNDGALGNEGMSEFTYLLYKPITLEPPTAAAKQFCVRSDADEPFHITNSPDENLGIGLGPCAVMLSAMTATTTAAKAGWFWTGGVVPTDKKLFKGSASPLAGTFATTSAVVVGPITAADLEADAIGIGPAVEGDAAGILSYINGYATAADD